MMLHLGFFFYFDTFWREQAQYTNQYTNRVYWICVLGILGQRGIIWMMCRNITFAGTQ